MATNVQVLQKGFGSYLNGIYPSDQVDIAVAAGAFSRAMQQIKNITSSKIEKFAEIVYNLESVSTLNINGTTVPVDIALAKKSMTVAAKGSGPYGTYTMSDFLGCVSGLPYNSKLETIYNLIGQLETPLLYRTYRENYLAVTWEKATATLEYAVFYENVQQWTPNAANPAYPATDPVNPYLMCGTGLPTTQKYCTPRLDNWYYQITGIKLNNPGGGYGREGALPPNVTIRTSTSDVTPNPSGAVGKCAIGTNDKNVPGDFGRVTQLWLTTNGVRVFLKQQQNIENNDPTDQPPPSEWAAPIPTATIDPPPGPGWPGMNQIIQGYINTANAEIIRIQKANPDKCQTLNNAWNATGLQLTIEQLSRTTGLPKLPPQFSGSRDATYSSTPAAQFAFVDAMPTYAKNTLPHMYAQTLEAIADQSNVGGRSVIGQMREIRNQDRLTKTGIMLDNNIPDMLTPQEQSNLIYHGIIPTNGSVTPAAKLVAQTAAGTFISPLPSPNIAPPGTAIGNTTSGNTIVTSSTGNVVIGPTTGGIPGITPGATTTVPEVTGTIPTTSGTPGISGGLLTGTIGGSSTGTVTTGPGSNNGIGGIGTTGSIGGGPGTIAGVPAPRGPATAGMIPSYNYGELIPPTLATDYLQYALLPSNLNVSDAIDYVIKCNCDCWLLTK